MSTGFSSSHTYKKIENKITDKSFFYLTILKFSLGIIFSMLFRCGKIYFVSKKTMPRIITKVIANFVIAIILTLELFFYKLHIFLVNFKLRHICVFQ